MNKNIVIFFLLLSIAKGFSQKDSITKNILKNITVYPSIGVSYQKQIVGEIGVLVAKSISSGKRQPGLLFGYKLASEFNFDDKDFYLGPKLAFEADVYLISARLNIIDYTNTTYHDLKFTPEIGVSLFGIANLHYGYNIPLTASNIKTVGTHRITLTVNIGEYKPH